MRPSRVALLVWTVVVVVLVVLEIAEVTRLFTVPFSRALLDPLVLLVSLVFTTVIAVVGAIFVGVSMTARLLSPRGFSPFEEEMLRMRSDLTELRRLVDELAHPHPPAAAPAEPTAGTEEAPP